MNQREATAATVSADQIAGTIVTSSSSSKATGSASNFRLQRLLQAVHASSKNSPTKESNELNKTSGIMLVYSDQPDNKSFHIHIDKKSNVTDRLTAGVWNLLENNEIFHKWIPIPDSKNDASHISSKRR